MRGVLNTRGRALALAVACALTFLFYLSGFMRVPIIPIYAQQLGASSLQVGAIASSYMVVAAVLGFPVGTYLDRKGRRGAILAGVGVNAVASAFLPFTSDVVHVAAIYALAGAGMGAASPAIAALVGDISHSTYMARSYGWYTTSMQVGMAGGPALGGVLAGLWGYGPVFICSAVVGGVALAVALLWVREPPRVPSHAATSRPQAASGRRWNLGRMVTLGWVGTLAYAFTFGVIHPFFPLYATGSGMSLGAVGGLLAVQSIFNAVARVPMGHVSDRLDSRTPFIIGGMLCLSVVAVACVVTLDFVLLVALFAAVGFSSGTINMALSASLAESAPPGTRGMAMGGQSTARFAGFAGSPLLVGAILPTAGYVASFAAAAAVCAAGALAYLVVCRKRVGAR